MKGKQEDLGGWVMDRLIQLSDISEPGPGVTRIFGTPEHKRAIELVGSWMEEAGMDWRMDDIANVVGSYPASEEAAPTLIIGSHIDSVREGGAFDGAMGIVLPICCVHELNRTNRRLPFAIEVIAFSDEEGVRYGTTLLGSKALAGTFDQGTLDCLDDSGITLREALSQFGCIPDRIASIARDRREVVGYLEAHIEQGPVLEEQNLPVGIVSAICHGVRQRISVNGMAGHAGTVPMDKRRDALCAAAEAILALEKAAEKTGGGAVGTVGTMTILPGAINVIPGEVSFTVDLRGPSSDILAELIEGAGAAMHAIAARREVFLEIETPYEGKGCAMSPSLMQRLQKAVKSQGFQPLVLPSGAGHDAMAMAELCDVAMLFVRCAGGISHNPAESVNVADLDVAVRVMLSAIEQMAVSGLR